MVAGTKEEKYTADKIFEMLLNRFGTRSNDQQTVMRFEEMRQRDDETIV